MEIPIANIFYLLSYAWDVLDESESLVHVNAVEKIELLDLFANVLVNGIRRLRKRGFDRGYVPRQGVISGVRGKLLVSPTLRHSLLERGQAACLWSELEYDTPPNRILKATLVNLLKQKELGPKSREAVREIYRWFESVQPIRLRDADFDRIQLHRNNKTYRLLLHICEFIREFSLAEAGGDQRKFRDFIRDNLWKLFQNFVTNFYKRHLGSWRVTSPSIAWKIDVFAQTRATHLLPSMQTDLCLESDKRSIIMDTKFYVETLKSNQYGAQKLASSHVYQLFAYLMQQSSTAEWKNSEGVLLYPKTKDDLVFEFTTYGHRIRAVTIDLRLSWQEICDGLLKIVDM